MLHPSYAELTEVLNRDSESDNRITSRYTIVIAASKRARQIIDGAQPMTYAPTDKAVSIAVNEMYAGKIKVRQLWSKNNSETQEGSDTTLDFAYEDEE